MRHFKFIEFMALNIIFMHRNALLLVDVNEKFLNDLKNQKIKDVKNKKKKAEK